MLPVVALSVRRVLQALLTMTQIRGHHVYRAWLVKSVQSHLLFALRV